MSTGNYQVIYRQFIEIFRHIFKNISWIRGKNDH
jgi:hypothetical protein